MTRRKFHFEDFFTVEVRKIEQDLSYDYSVDGVAGTVMECLEDKLSPGLFDTLYDCCSGSIIAHSWSWQKTCWTLPSVM